MKKLIFAVPALLFASLAVAQAAPQNAHNREYRNWRNPVVTVKGTEERAFSTVNMDAGNVHNREFRNWRESDAYGKGLEKIAFPVVTIETDNVRSNQYTNWRNRTANADGRAVGKSFYLSEGNDGG